MSQSGPELDFRRIALVGHAGVGKTKVARSFWKLWGYERISYAHPLKCMVAALLRTSYTDVSHRQFKARVLNAELGTTNRSLLEAVGEAVRSVAGADYFIRRLEQDLVDSGRDLVVVDDMRKPIEWTHWATKGGVMVALHPTFRMDPPTDAHAESVEALMKEADYHISVDYRGGFTLDGALKEGIDSAVKATLLKRMETHKEAAK